MHLQETASFHTTVTAKADSYFIVYRQRFSAATTGPELVCSFHLTGHSLSLMSYSCGMSTSFLILSNCLVEATAAARVGFAMSYLDVIAVY